MTSTSIIRSSPRLRWLVAVLLFFALMAFVELISSANAQENRLENGREQRTDYQAETMFIQCQLAQDDVLELPDQQAAQVLAICEGYSTPAEALATERDR